MPAILSVSDPRLNHLLKTINHLLQNNFIIIGHRGAAGLVAENTLASFRCALKWRCAMIELDVHTVLDADSHPQLVVIHDETLERTTNGRGKVSAHSLQQLRSVQAENGQKIPLLEEVMALLRAHYAKSKTMVSLNIELKGKQTATSVAKFLTKHHDWPCLVSSFDHQQLFDFRKDDKITPVAPLFNRFDKNWQETATALDAWAVNIGKNMVNEERVARIRDAGYRVFVYTVNNLVQAKRLKAYGVNGVFSDRPDELATLNN